MVVGQKWSDLLRSTTYLPPFSLPNRKNRTATTIKLSKMVVAVDFGTLTLFLATIAAANPHELRTYLLAGSKVLLTLLLLRTSQCFPIFSNDSSAPPFKKWWYDIYDYERCRYS